MNPSEDILSAAEARDGYRAAIAASPINTAARANQRYELFFDPQADIIAAEANAIPLCAGAKIAILDPTADAGFPHTRAGGVICLPAGILSRGRAALRTTLRHEALHLHQRDHPTLWTNAVAADGWSRISPAQVSPLLLDRVRLNPDTLGGAAGLWAWDSFHVPLPLFSRSDSPSLASAPVKWLDLRSGTLFPTAPASFSARYGPAPPQPEHPFELLAVELSEKGVQTHQHVVDSLPHF